MATASSRDGKLAMTLETTSGVFARGYISGAYQISSAGASKNADGTIEFSWDPNAVSAGVMPIGTNVTFKPYSCASTHQALASVNITAEDLVYAAAAGALHKTYAAGLLPEGRALNTAVAASGDAVEYIRVVMCPSLYTLFAGVAAAGPITLTGAQVGDNVLGFVNVTDGAVVANDGTVFERVITVANQLQQASASDLSSKKYTVILYRPLVA